jgi:phosphoribosyl 1,2-cyclic phosphate phosphodiesterase
MRLTFLGTGAAEGVPPVYGRTAFHERVRREGGADLRTRSSLRIGDHHQIDFSPDNFWQMHRNATDMYDVQHLLVSHSHEDHFDFGQVVSKEMPDGTNGRPLHVSLSRLAHDWLLRLLECAGHFAGMPEEKVAAFWERYPLHPLDYFEGYDMGGIAAETVAGNHTVAATGERSINYLLTLPDNSRLLYALDTGYYTDDAWEYLQVRSADLVIMDCTFGGRTDRGDYPSGHLDCYSFHRMLERMNRIGFIHEGSRIFATHVNPDQGWDHAALQAFFDEREFPVTVAYDGLALDIGT